MHNMGSDIANVTLSICVKYAWPHKEPSHTLQPSLYAMHNCRSRCKGCAHDNLAMSVQATYLNLKVCLVRLCLYGLVHLQRGLSFAAFLLELLLQVSQLAVSLQQCSFLVQQGCCQPLDLLLTLLHLCLRQPNMSRLNASCGTPEWGTTKQAECRRDCCIIHQQVCLNGVVKAEIKPQLP